MYIFVGLGNPGSQYANNRHNVGFMQINDLHKAFSFYPFKEKQKGIYAQGKIGKHDCILVKPQTFMNLSGNCVSQVVRFFKVPLENVIIFHDELDVQLGRIKVKQGGGAGGHNGLKSLDQMIGNNYWRMRIGIDHPGHRDMVSGYVLSNFTNTEFEVVEKVISSITENIENFLNKKDTAKFTNDVLRMLS
jgi:PTH1 family peptidyl-tRNA hydrolase